MLMADIAVINKVDSAAAEDVASLRNTISQHNPNAEIVLAESDIMAETDDGINGRRVLVIEDGPTLTHGDMTFGAGTIAARRYGAAEIIDPRPYLNGSLKETFEKYPHIGALLPAMGYSPAQMNDMTETINQADCDAVVSATPIDLAKLLNVNKPTIRIRYGYKDHNTPTLASIIRQRLNALGR